MLFLIKLVTSQNYVRCCGNEKTQYCLIYSLNDFSRTSSINILLIIIIVISGLKLIQVEQHNEKFVCE